MTADDLALHVLSSSRFARRLPPTWLHALLRAGRPTEWRDGQELVSAEAVATFLVLVVEGEVKVHRRTHGAQTEARGHCGPGSMFGLSVLTQREETCSFTARGSVRGVIWLRSTLQGVLAGAPGLEQQLATRLSAWDREGELVQQLGRSVLYSDTPPLLLEDLVRSSTLMHLPSGSLVCEQGAPSDAFYYLVRGELTVSRNDGDGPRPVSRMYPGDSVGELALITGAPRTATIVAERPSEVLVVDAASFAVLNRESAAFRRNVRALGEERTARNVGRGDARLLWLLNRSPYPITLLAGLLGQELEASYTEEVLLVLVGDLDERRVYHDEVLVVSADLGAVRHALRSTVTAGRHHHVIVLALPEDEALVLEAVAEFLPTAVFLCSSEAQRLPVEGIPRVIRAELHGPAEAGQAWDATRPGTVRLLLAERPEALPMYLAELAPGTRAAVGRLGRAVTQRLVGVALSGGAAWGFGHVALLEALEDAHIPVDVISGVSFGALVGAAWASGGRPCAEALVAASPRMNLLLVFSLVSTWAIGGFIASLLEHDRLEELPTPFLPCAVDVQTGRERVFREGSIAHAVRASGSMPGVFAGTLYENTRYVDGGVRNNVPVDSLAREGANLLLASHIVPAPAAMPGVRHLTRWDRALQEAWIGGRLQDTVRSLFFMFNHIGQQQASRADVSFTPDLSDFLAADFGRADRIVERAAEQVEPALGLMRERWAGLCRPGRGG